MRPLTYFLRFVAKIKQTICLMVRPEDQDLRNDTYFPLWVYQPSSPHHLHHYHLRVPLSFSSYWSSEPSPFLKRFHIEGRTIPPLGQQSREDPNIWGGTGSHTREPIINSTDYNQVGELYLVTLQRRIVISIIGITYNTCRGWIYIDRMPWQIR